MAELLKGKPIADKIKENLKSQISKFTSAPKLVALQIGENQVSEVYIKNQKKQAELLGIEYELKKLEEAVTQKDAEAVIQQINKDGKVTAIIVQLPAPKHINAKALVNLINPLK
ncbi:MAG: bifunctional 5,10-methylenetetrahydrofolate dehydrogenase/5,10-methenyltetrahydrofolate cyclohydrolase, partial [Candidatus Omnitrophica bacterium]|nr:bifunctional 5,10-methylenetetrahydrofolate dehydrogenase/5,10-methenyltetrahydrofolate cyclohydrolase [Candidatus Omnitrophota bacterium]